MNSPSILKTLRTSRASLNNFFTSVRDNIVFQMRLFEFDDENSLQIKMLYCDVEQEYQLLLTQEDLQMEKSFRDKFESPNSLFTHIRTNFESIRLLSHGIINIQMSSNAEDLCIQLKTQMCKTIRECSLVIKDLAEKISELKLEAQQRNQGLMQQNLELQQKILNKGRALSNMEGRVTQLKDIIKNQDEQISQLRRILEMVLKEGSPTKKSPKSNSTKSSLKRSEDIQKVEQFRVNDLLPHHSHDNNRRHFIVKDNLLTRDSMTKNWQNFILQHKIQPNCTSKIQFKIIKSDLSSINIGITSKSTFNQNNTRVNVDQASYSMFGHDLWIGGKKYEVSQSQRVKVGDFISVDVNLVTMSIQFYRRCGIHEEKELLFEGKIPVHLQRKALYFFVAIRYVDDQVRLM